MAEISIIIPVLNSIDYIDECIKSVVDQTFDDIEIIVVDAGSTDGTLDVLQKYCDMDNRVQIIRSDRKSMGYQYNLGIAKSQGKYIGFVESDDYVSQTMFETLYSEITEKNVEYVKSDFYNFIDAKERVTTYYNVTGSVSHDLYGKVINPHDYPNIVSYDMNMWNGLYSKNFIVSNGIKLNETPKASFQDMGFVLQTLLFAKRALYIQTDSYYYRRDNTGASTYSPNTIEFVLWEFAFMLDKMKENINSVIGVRILERFINLFGGYYGRLLVEGKSNTENSIERIREEFNDILTKWMGDLDPFYISYIRKSARLDIEMLKDDPEFYSQYRIKDSVISRKMSDLMYVALQYEEVVIFGAGKYGEYAYGTLKANGYSGKICFCDNAQEKWGKQYMDADIVSPEEAAKKHGKAFYMIANAKHAEEIYQQLRSLGICGKRITRVHGINAFSALAKRS